MFRSFPGKRRLLSGEEPRGEARRGEGQRRMRSRLGGRGKGGRGRRGSFPEAGRSLSLGSTQLHCLEVRVPEGAWRGVAWGGPEETSGAEVLGLLS